MNNVYISTLPWAKGSAFFENEKRRDAAVTKRIHAMLARYEKIKDLNLSLETQVADNMVSALLREEKESEREIYG